MHIRDAIHENIQLNELERQIIDTKEMQRLRSIKQLDFSYLVFPGANHTRFEHSIGTMQITKDLARSIYGEDQEELALVGLLHDIGHGPFSHQSEPIIEKYLKKNHEQIGGGIVRNSQIKDIIANSSLSFKKVISYFDGSDIPIVSGALGSDRIDYLMRDSHYTGVAYGIIDYGRIRGKLTLYKNKPAIYEESMSAAESFLIARYFMHVNVYGHHAKLIAQAMFQKELDYAVREGLVGIEDVASSTDSSIMEKLSSLATSRNLAVMISQRRLFKRAYYKPVKEVKVKEIADALQKKGFDDKEYIIALKEFKGAGDNIEVVNRDKKSEGKLSRLSPLVKTLLGILASDKKLLVACDIKNVEKVGKIVEKALG